MRHIKDYKNMLKEGLLISLLKSERSVAELHKNNSDNIAIEKTRKKFNELRDKFSRSKIKKNQKKALQNRKKKNLFRLEKEKIEQYIAELEKKNLSRLEEEKIEQYY